VCDLELPYNYGEKKRKRGVGRGAILKFMTLSASICIRKRLRGARVEKEAALSASLLHRAARLSALRLGG